MAKTTIPSKARSHQTQWTAQFADRKKRIDPRPMKALILLVSSSIIALVGCNTSASPKFGWKPFHEETFETQALAYKPFAIPQTVSKLRVTIQADSAVFGGVLPKARLIASQPTHKTRHLADIGKRPCSLESVDKDEVTCEISNDEPMVFIVRDSRSVGTFVTGLAGAFVRSPKLVEQAALPNKIKISLSAWQCIEDCREPE
jgi:hypothetical protein